MVSEKERLKSFLTGVFDAVVTWVGWLEAFTTVYAVLVLHRRAVMPFIQFLVDTMGVYSLIPLFFLRHILVLISPLEARIALLIWWSYWIPVNLELL